MTVSQGNWGRKPKARGNRYEKYISERLQRFFPGTKRNLGSGGYGGGDLVDRAESFESTGAKPLTLCAK